MKTKLLPVLYLCLRSIVDDEVRLLLEVSLCLWTDEHICNEVSLPCHLHDEANLHACVAVCATEAINNIELLVAELFLGNLLDSFPSLKACAVVIVVILLRIPPYGVVRSGIVNDELVLRRTASVDTCHAVHSAELCLNTLVETLETCLCLLIEQNLVRRIVQNLSSTCLDSVACQY